MKKRSIVDRIIDKGKQLIEGGEEKSMKKGSRVETIEVTVVRSGTSFKKEVTLNGNRSINDALKAAGINQKESENVLVNNEEVDNPSKYQLEDGDRIVLIKDVAGGIN